MKRAKINTSVPAYLSDFTSETNEMFSRAKLKVFYVGETADKRLFTENFAKEIIKTLPYTPVVSKYDSDKDDFVGHAEQQNIYGIVDPLREVTLEEIDGQTWAVAEVVLYTERPDETGSIAKKIIGKPHSLELDPKTLQYKINYDKYRKLKNIEFTAGNFVGVSVLGDDQQPAFTGSAFFAIDSEFSKKMDLLKDYLKNSAEESNRMEEPIRNFVELSFGETSKSVCKTLDNLYGMNYYIVDMYNSSVVFYLYHEETGECELLRADYTMEENGECQLGSAKKVRVTYEEIVEISENAECNPEEKKEEDAVCNPEEKKEENCECAPETEEPEKKEEENYEVIPDEKKEEDEVVEDTEKKEEHCECNPEDKEEEPKEETFEEEQPAEEIPEDKEEKDFSAQPEAEESTIEEGLNEPSDASTFTESERQELEALKRNEKIVLINSYASDLGEEVLSKYIAEVDSFEKDALELELLKAYRAAQSSAKKPTTIKAFRYVNDNTSANRLSLDELVNRYKS